MKLSRFNLHPAGDPATEEAVAHYRETFSPEDLSGTIAGLEPGEGGYTAYHVATVDKDGKVWLAPLFQVTQEQTSPSEAFVMREYHGYIVDFRPRVVEGRDRFYEEIIPGGDQRLGIPVVDVIGEPEQIPGYYCDENGRPPSPGPNGEHYHDFDEVDRFHDVRQVYRDLGLAVPAAFESPVPGNTTES